MFALETVSRYVGERTEYYDLTAESEDLFALGLWEQNDLTETVQARLFKGDTVHLPLGTQFWQGEPVQLWSAATEGGSDIYLYRKDGTGELLLEKVSNEYGTYDKYESRHR